MALVANALSSIAEMQRKISALAVDYLADHAETGVPDDDVTNDAINQATGEIFNYVRKKYSAASAAANVTCRRWGTAVACYFDFQNRGNPIPESLQAEFDRIMDPEKGLLYTMFGLPILADVELSYDPRPCVSNISINRSRGRRKQEVIRSTSTDAPSSLPQNFTWDFPGDYR